MLSHNLYRLINLLIVVELASFGFDVEAGQGMENRPKVAIGP